VEELQKLRDLDLMEICTPGNSTLNQAVRDRGGQAVRPSIWTWLDLATARAREQERDLVRLAGHRLRRVWWTPPGSPWSCDK